LTWPRLTQQCFFFHPTLACSTSCSLFLLVFQCGFFYSTTTNFPGDAAQRLLRESHSDMIFSLHFINLYKTQFDQRSPCKMLIVYWTYKRRSIPATWRRFSCSFCKYHFNKENNVHTCTLFLLHIAHTTTHISRRLSSRWPAGDRAVNNIFHSIHQSLLWTYLYIRSNHHALSGVTHSLT
jgi:hypothetical protein